MPKTKYHNPQNDVVKLIDGARVPVHAYDMYAAMHAAPQKRPASNPAAGPTQAARTASPRTNLPPAEAQIAPQDDVYFVFDGQNMTLVENYGQNTIVRRMPAVSGRQNEDGSFSYSKERQYMKNTGPIPEGRHSIDLNTIRYIKDTSFFNRAASTATGVYNTLARRTGMPTVKLGSFPGGRTAWGEGSVDIRLDPQVAQETGRSGLTAHGGWVPGSAGCIDLVDNDKEFFRQLERLRDKRNEIPLIVDYSQTPEKVRWQE